VNAMTASMTSTIRVTPGPQYLLLAVKFLPFAARKNRNAASIGAAVFTPYGCGGKWAL
jgi:hypothetical protein